MDMDEVSGRISLNKATLYKYLKSKKDIVRGMVDDHIAHLRDVKFATGGIDEALENISWDYIMAVLTTVATSQIFLEDLQNKFPDIYADFYDALDEMANRFLAFHEDARHEGIFGL